MFQIVVVDPLVFRSTWESELKVNQNVGHADRLAGAVTSSLYQSAKLKSAQP